MLAIIHATLAYFALTMTILSLWVKRSPWIWGSFLIFAFVLGYFAKIITPIALAPIGALLFLHALIKGEIKGLARFILVASASAASFGLWFHLFPGFHNFQILDNVQISPGAYPISLYLDFDKPFIGIFVLALGFPLISNLREFGKVLKTAIPLTLGGILIILLLATYSGLMRWDPKFSSLFWVFIVENLIFVVIGEEAFLRGFIQNEFFRWFGGKGVNANIFSVLITAFLFAALHYNWVTNLPFLGLVFVTGIVYGSIYQFTKALEASILCHWLFNLIHFSLFTYPVLKF